MLRKEDELRNRLKLKNSIGNKMLRGGTSARAPLEPEIAIRQSLEVPSSNVGRSISSERRRPLSASKLMN